MMKHSLLAFTFTLTFTSAFALSPVPGLKETEKLGEVTSYQYVGKDVEVNGMPSEFGFEDLTKKELANLESLIKVKQEYGKMFGFEGWKSSGMKLVEENDKRIVLIEGHYKDAEKKPVHFIEVYWANKNTSGQYLITSSSVKLKMDHFSEYLR